MMKVAAQRMQTVNQQAAAKRGLEVLSSQARETATWLVNELSWAGAKIKGWNSHLSHLDARGSRERLLQPEGT